MKSKRLASSQNPHEIMRTEALRESRKRRQHSGVLTPDVVLVEHIQSLKGKTRQASSSGQSETTTKAILQQSVRLRALTPSDSSEVKGGTVKWFDSKKGYGFISLTVGGKDLFIHITALRRSGVIELVPGQRVRVEVVNGKKGFEARRIAVFSNDLVAPSSTLKAARWS